MLLHDGSIKKKNYGIEQLMHNIFDLLNGNHASLPLQKILEIENIDPRLKLQDLIATTQKQWLRPSDSERWHLHETKTTSEQERLFKLFKKIGIIDTILPTRATYDYVLFMGGDIHGMQERLDFLTQLVKNGLKAQELVLITAQRPLDVDHELRHLQDTNLATEYHLLQFLYNKSELLSKMRATYINTPNVIKNGKVYRATTPDGFLEWLKAKPTPGNALVISSQPLIGYQHAVALTLLRTFGIESVGPESSTAVTTPEYLDTLARWLYQEGKLKKVI